MGTAFPMEQKMAQVNAKAENIVGSLMDNLDADGVITIPLRRVEKK